MTTSAFQAAITPQLQQRVKTWLLTRLDITQQADLARHYRERLTSAFARPGCLPEARNFMLTLSVKKNNPEDLHPDLIALFFLFSARYERIDNTASVTLRANSYYARLQSFLLSLEVVLVDHSLRAESAVKGHRKSYNGKLLAAAAAQAGAAPARSQIIYNGRALSI